MFDLKRRYNRPIVPPIAPPIVDQTCTFKCIIPAGNGRSIKHMIGVGMNQLGGMGLYGVIPIQTSSTLRHQSLKLTRKYYQKEIPATTISMRYHMDTQRVLI